LGRGDFRAEERGKKGLNIGTKSIPGGGIGVLTRGKREKRTLNCPRKKERCSPEKKERGGHEFGERGNTFVYVPHKNCRARWRKEEKPPRWRVMLPEKSLKKNRLRKKRKIPYRAAVKGGPGEVSKKKEGRGGGFAGLARGVQSIGRSERGVKLFLGTGEGGGKLNHRPKEKKVPRVGGKGGGDGQKKWRISYQS